MNTTWAFNRRVLDGALCVSGAKRYKKVAKGNIARISRSDIRRLARRGGVKRISAVIYSEIRDAIVTFLKKVVHDAVIYCDYAKRRTVNVTYPHFVLYRC
ncbi:Histone H4 [Colletotrichum trifolii]|uniref:Histone H4 n=1 Tax=Colletotrichum trifolii TaxID=5466 RepID=A0A4R8RI11_COLTR|nr:Histone H4 [Colletotrichum trifolii]